MSKIKVDTLEHSTAGSIATNYVVEGSAKAWAMYDSEVTASVNASLNVASITDNATGDDNISFTNAFSSVNISIVGTVAENSSSGQTASRIFHLDEDDLSATSPRLFCKNMSGSPLNACSGSSFVVHGDLA